MENRPSYEELLALVKSMSTRIKELEAKLSRYENPKNSGNSSIAPSQDPFKKTKSLRKPSKKSPGGQKGHKGSNLKIVSQVDQVILHDVTSCICCGNDLSQGVELYDLRQVFDIPTISIKVTEHRRAKKRCGYCGKQNMGSFPKELTQKAQYGSNLKSLCVYLQNYQMLPFARCAEFIYDLTGHQLSTASLSNFQKQCYAHLQNYEQQITKQLLQNTLLHADETGIRLNGKNTWIHVISNKTISFFAHHLKRGKKAMDAIGILEKYNGTLVHDRFSSYFSYQCEHSLCNALILRDLIYVEEAFEASWAKRIRELLVRAKKHKQKNPNLKASYYSRIYKEYVAIIRPIIKSYDKKFKKTDEQRLAFALEKHKDLFLKYIKQADIPFDNNQAERDLRMIKVKQKVSGCFRSQTHAQYFATIRGYIATVKKNKENVLEQIKQAFNKNYFLPKITAE